MSIQTGVISRIENHGSIILVLLQVEQGWLVPVAFDHRPFHWLLEAEHCRPEELIGREASYNGDTLSFENHE